jgi:hypothetical protein
MTIIIAIVAFFAGSTLGTVAAALAFAARRND